MNINLFNTKQISNKFFYKGEVSKTQKRTSPVRKVFLKIRNINLLYIEQFS
jgi:hypothetical protein